MHFITVLQRRAGTGGSGNGRSSGCCGEVRHGNSTLPSQNSHPKSHGKVLWRMIHQKWDGGKKLPLRFPCSAERGKDVILMVSHQEQVLGEKAVQRGEVAPEEFLNPFFLPVRNPASCAVFKNEILCPNITSQL